MANTEDRFIKTYSQGGFVNNIVQIWVDKITGVNYLFTQSGYAGGLTVLVDAEGKPIVTPVPCDEE
jgi:hypothetical protein